MTGRFTGFSSTGHPAFNKKSDGFPAKNPYTKTALKRPALRVRCDPIRHFCRIALSCISNLAIRSACSSATKFLSEGSGGRNPQIGGKRACSADRQPPAIRPARQRSGLSVGFFPCLSSNQRPLGRKNPRGRPPGGFLFFGSRYVPSFRTTRSVDLKLEWLVRTV